MTGHRVCFPVELSSCLLNQYKFWPSPMHSCDQRPAFRHRWCVRIPLPCVLFKWLVQYKALWFLCWLKSHLLQVLCVSYDGLPSYSSLSLFFFFSGLANPYQSFFLQKLIYIFGQIFSCCLPFLPHCEAWTDLCLQIQLGFGLKKNTEWKVMSLYNIYEITCIMCEKVLIFPHP